MAKQFAVFEGKVELDSGLSSASGVLELVHSEPEMALYSYFYQSYDSR